VDAAGLLAASMASALVSEAAMTGAAGSWAVSALRTASGARVPNTAGRSASSAPAGDQRIGIDIEIDARRQACAGRAEPRFSMSSSRSAICTSVSCSA
jgi:hypothetical protein